MATNSMGIDFLLRAKADLGDIEKTKTAIAALTKSLADAQKVAGQPLQLVSRAADSVSIETAAIKAARTIISQSAEEMRSRMDSVKQSAQGIAEAFKAADQPAQKLRSNLRNTVLNSSADGFSDVLKLGASIAIAQRAAGAFLAIPTAMKEAVEEGIDFNAMLEQQSVAFVTLLDSADAAKVRVSELFRFAAETPFEFGEVIQADRILQSMTNGALADAKGLKIVGDAASAVGAPFQEAALWIGRLYSGLNSGVPVGEATMRLSLMGLISGDTARNLEQLAESGGAVGNAMDVIQKTFGRFGGAMQQQSLTLNGEISTLKDNFRQLAGSNTVEFFENVRLAVTGLNSVLGSNGLNNYLQAVRLTLDALSFGELWRAIGSKSAGGTLGGGAREGTPFQGEKDGSNASHFSPALIAQSDALEKSIQHLIKAKRDAGELDDDEAARLAKQLRLIEGVTDAQDRLTRARALASNISRGTAPGANKEGSQVPAQPVVSDAEKKVSDDIEKEYEASQESLMTHQQALDNQEFNEMATVLAAFKNNQEGAQVELLKVHEIFKQKREDLDKQEADDAIKRTVDVTKARNDAETAFSDFHLKRTLADASASVQIGKFDTQSTTAAINEAYAQREKQVLSFSELRKSSELAGAAMIKDESERAATIQKINDLSVEDLQKQLFELGKARIEEMEKIKKDAAQAEINRSEKQLDLELARLEKEKAETEASYRLTENEKHKLEIANATQVRDAYAKKSFNARASSVNADDPQSSTMYELQAQGFDAKSRQADAKLSGLQKQPDPDSIGDQMSQVMTNLRNQWGSTAKQMADSFQNVFNSAITSISDGITGLIMRTKSWGQALTEIGMSILTSVVGAIVQMGVRWVATRIMMATVGKAVDAVGLAAALAVAAAYSEIWTAPAVLSTIASDGASADAAPGLVAAAVGIAQGDPFESFAVGGYTGDGGKYEPAGIVHRGEFVVPSDIVKQYGVGYFDSLIKGYASGGYVGALDANFGSIPRALSFELPDTHSTQHPAAKKTNNANFAAFNSETAAKNWLKSREGDAFLLDWASRNVRQFSGRA